MKIWIRKTAFCSFHNNSVHGFTFQNFFQYLSFFFNRIVGKWQLNHIPLFWKSLFYSFYDRRKNIFVNIRCNDCNSFCVLLSFFGFGNVCSASPFSFQHSFITQNRNCMTHSLTTYSENGYQFILWINPVSNCKFAFCNFLSDPIHNLNILTFLLCHNSSPRLYILNI